MKKALKSALHYLGYEIRPVHDRYVVFDENYDRDYELLKSFTARAARFSDSPEQMRAVRYLHWTGLLREQPFREQIRIDIGDDHTRNIGVWGRSTPGRKVPFVRKPERRDEWFYWASKERIEARRPKWRLALVGESVARGYLYDPHFNLADALQTMLEAQLGRGKVDVVDLAKSNLSMQELKATIGQSLALRPDIVVVFAGNNWRAQLTDQDVPYAESVLRKDGVPGLKGYLDDRREQAVRNLVFQVNGILAPRLTKVIWVVPEFNLDDWVDPASNAPYLPRYGNRQWCALGRQAKQALQSGDYESAYELATKMTRLDGGASSVPLRMLATCARYRGDLDATRHYLELCRDAEGWDPSFSYSPRVSTLIQNVLRCADALQGNAVVDLPEIFRRHLGEGLPDRRIFLDYCHLTAEGIGVTAATVASKVLSFLVGGSFPFEDLHAAFSPPPDKVEGKACFLAAVHNAHFYQGSAIVGHWLDRAVRFWPESAQLMIRFIEYETRAVPMLTCKSGRELVELDELDTLRYLSRGGARRLDLTLCNAVVACVKKLGIDIEREIAELRVRQHSIERPRELTDFYYSSSIPGYSERGWTSRSLPVNRGSRSIYASAFWETSDFVFFAKKGQTLAIRFAYRVPMLSDSAGSVAIDVNGHRLAQLPARETWLSREMSVPGDWIVQGANEIVVSWPTEAPSSQLALDRLADHLIARRLPYFFRVFGDIHTLSVFTPTASSSPPSAVEAIAVPPGD